MTTCLFPLWMGQIKLCILAFSLGFACQQKNHREVAFVPGGNGFRAWWGSGLGWFAAGVDFGLLRAGCPIAHGECHLFTIVFTHVYCLKYLLLHS